MSKRFAVLTLALTVAVATVLSASQAKPGSAPAPKSKVLASLQGAWLMISSNGQDMAGSGQEVIVTITDNKYVQTVNGQVVEQGTFKIDEAKKPLAVDIQITEGENAGMSQVGVLEVDGKTMSGKLGQPGTTVRPTDFATSEGFFTFTATKK